MNWKLLPLLLTALALPGAAFTAETSDPVGAFRIRLRGNSDTIVSLPLQRLPLVEAAIATRTGNTLLLDADVPALPAEGAFALVMSGALEGAVLPISGLSARTLTVDASGFDLATLKTVTVHGTPLADLIAVVPYWTLDTLFPRGQSVHASTSAVVRNTEILLSDPTRVGINQSASATFFYFSGATGAPAGWYKVGGDGTPLGSQRLPPHAYIIVRHNLATDTSLLFAGGVQMAGFRIPISVRAANRQQDNLVALPIATPITLAASRLVSSGAFAPSPNAVNRTDELLVFDNSIVGKNKSAVATYFYFGGNTTLPPAWYRVGDTAQTADAVLLRPGEGYVIRKQAAATTRTDQWSAVPAYLQ